MSNKMIEGGVASAAPSVSKEDKQAVGRVAITVSALAVCAWLGTGVVLNGIVFGILMFVAVYIVCTRVPGMNSLMIKAGGLMDIVATVATFILLGGSVTAMVAAATVGALFTVMLSMKKWTAPKGMLDKLLNDTEEKLRRYAEK